MLGLCQQYDVKTKKTRMIQIEIDNTPRIPSETLEEKIDKRLKEKGLIA